MKYILFVGENTADTDDIKMRQAIQIKIRLCRLGKNRFCTLLRIAEKDLIDFWMQQKWTIPVQYINALPCKMYVHYY